MKLLPKFICSLGILGVVITVAVSLFSYGNSKEYLEDMYAFRVTSGSRSIADMLSPEDIKAIISGESGPGSDAYDRTEKLLSSLKQDGDITYLSLVVPDEDSVTFYIDTSVDEMGDDPAEQIPYGSDILYTDAAGDEEDLKNYIIIWELYAQNRGTDVPLVTDNSYGYNYTSVSPVLDENGRAIAEIQYILDMGEVRAYLNSFLYSMVFISLVIIGISLLVYIVFVRWVVTAPIGKLARFTDDITASGEFSNHRIDIRTGDEIEKLGQSFNYMLEKLEQYIENLSAITAEKERIGAELNVAAKIQTDMLPCIFPAFPERREFDIYATMTPAKEVGGDFYDFFLIDDDHLAMVMADVSGKGVPAALFMVIAKTLIKNAAQTGLSPKAVLEKVNNQLCENNEADMFVTVWLGVMEISTGKLVAANAGHEYPAMRCKDGRFELVKDRHGFVLAGMENSRYTEYEMELGAGDILFVYTDGVPEATDAGNRLYGLDRMLEALNSSPSFVPVQILKTVKKDIDVFVGDAPQFDDITMMAVQRKAGTEEMMRKINVLPEIESLTRVCSFFENILRKHSVSEKVMTQINIVSDEIFSNIVYYSKATRVTVGCEIAGKKIILRFADNGRPYDPTKHADPDVDLPAEERKSGGLGILMVKKSMDRMIYEYADGFNILTVEKNDDFLK